MDDIKVSVYCLAYNHGKYIRKALDGFVMQKTNFQYEVIIHDDASTDDTAEIIKEYELKYPEIIKPVYQKENQKSQGVSIRDTHMIPRVRGKYVAYCEGDDFWIDENKLQKQFDIMESHPELFLCTHKVQCVSEDCIEKIKTIPGDHCGLKESKALLGEEMASLIYKDDGYPFHTCSYFIKRDVREDELRKIFRGKINGDQLMMRAGMYLGGVYYINEIMSCRRLWTVGNWNNQMKAMQREKRAAYVQKTIEGEILFDEVTEYRFHQYILQNVYQRLYLMVRDFGIKEHSDVIKKYKKENFIQIFKSKDTFNKVMKYYLWCFKKGAFKKH